MSPANILMRRAVFRAPFSGSRKNSLRVGASIALALSFLLIAYAVYIPVKAVVAQILLSRAWAATLEDGLAHRPWPWADIAPHAKLRLPKTGTQLIVLDNASGEAMAFGPGHMPNSAAIGARGTAIIAAHRDTSFRVLRALAPKDIIDVEARDGTRHRFRVTETRIVNTRASGLDPADGGPTGARLALVTCYPFEGVLGSPWRYVVLAERERQ